MNATYVSATSFTVVGDQTAIFSEGRAVQCDCGGDGIQYSWVLSSSFGDPNTTVTLQAGGGALTANLTTVSWSSAYSKSMPAKVFMPTGRVGVSALGKNSANPPAEAEYGITHVLEFTLNTDHAGYKFHVPSNYSGGDIHVHFHWTKSTADDDQSSKNVKWQLEYLAINGTSENCNTGESTDTVEDTYVSAVTNTQIVYQTDAIVISGAGLAVDDTLILDMSAVTPAGAALDDEPALVCVCIDCPHYQVPRDV